MSFGKPEHKMMDMLISMTISTEYHLPPLNGGDSGSLVQGHKSEGYCPL